MNLAEASLLDTKPLVALLERAFSDDALDGPGTRGVPTALWERALLGPLRDFLGRPGKELRARMVELGFALGGGVREQMPSTLPLLVEILHAGSLIIDDIEDESEQRRGLPTLHRVHGLPVALNAGNWLYFWPQVLLGSMALPAAARLEAHERISECLLRCHEGQALDLTARVTELARADVPVVVRTITTLKTGKLMGLACSLGAVAGGAPPRRIDALARFGCEVGVGLQMLDDLSGVINAARRDKALEDLRLGRSTWVWAWLAEELDATSYSELLERLRAAQQGEAALYEVVLARARFRLGMTGLRHVRRHFGSAQLALEHALGDGGFREVVSAEIEWLERKFLGTSC